MTKVSSQPADITKAFRTLGFPAGVPARIPAPDQYSYMGFSWYLIPHHRVSMVLYSIPPEAGMLNLPWESWYLDAGKTVHHVHYATRKHDTDHEWIQTEATDERPREVIGRLWYWFDDPDMSAILSR
jgi:hypothetical protein